MKIEWKDGLLFTEIKVTFNGRSKIINNVVIDTGASHTLISQDEVDELGIRVTRDDHFITSFGIGGEEHAFIKTIEAIEIEDYRIENIELDFAAFRYQGVNGLLGLDVLMAGKFNIDLNKLELLRLQS
ncbi:clan AA aspartic protease [Cohnella xylanilytica]|uniref:Clan AA aspartic protease n=1 Tax=Cohnella xylanilytica TaxID=557555 RepID=A0A841TWV8_9BACL|nr:retropepsin-like aspartic protease [Cohnella xylanilytica]MBB6690441.1 clan AA aspartic protease [Cohnella xylanilytica]